MIVVIFGTRPEAIKLGPVVAELRSRHVPIKLLCTGQHTTLLAGTPAETDLADATSLGLSSSGHIPLWLESAEGPLKTALGTVTDAVVVVQGDTMSALAGARAAKSLGMTLAHVEAGVRSHRADEPWPEEGFRVEIDHLANWYYAPTSTAYANLVAEGHRLERIRVTGNPVVSAMARYSDVKPSPADPRVLITMHRREWLQGRTVPDVLHALECGATAHPEIEFCWPMHPAVRQKVGRRAVPENLVLCQPLPYGQMLSRLASSLGVITDSGGLQEEAATLGVPCAVLRNVTDRPEAMEAGIQALFPPDGPGMRTAIELIVWKSLPRRPSAVFGSILSASNIAHHLASLLD